MILIITTIIEINPWHLVNQPEDSILLKKKNTPLDAKAKI